MTISRRQFLAAAALGGAAVAAAAVGTAMAAPSGPRGSRGDKYQGAGANPSAPAGHGDMVQQLPDGRWTSHLLPFGSFPNQASLDTHLKRGRAQGLFR